MISDVDGCTVRWASFGWARLRCTYSGLALSARTSAIAQRQITNTVIIIAMIGMYREEISNYDTLTFQEINYGSWLSSTVDWGRAIAQSPRLQCTFLCVCILPPPSLRITLSRPDLPLQELVECSWIWIIPIILLKEEKEVAKCTLTSSSSMVDVRVCRCNVHWETPWIFSKHPFAILKRAKRAYKSSLAVIYKIHKKIFQPAHLHIFFSSS